VGCVLQGVHDSQCVRRRRAPTTRRRWRCLLHYLLCCPPPKGPQFSIVTGFRRRRNSVRAQLGGESSQNDCRNRRRNHDPSAPRPLGPSATRRPGRRSSVRRSSGRDGPRRSCQTGPRTPCRRRPRQPLVDRRSGPRSPQCGSPTGTMRASAASSSALSPVRVSRNATRSSISRFDSSSGRMSGSRPSLGTPPSS